MLCCINSSRLNFERIEKLYPIFTYYVYIIYMYIVIVQSFVMEIDFDYISKLTTD